MAKATQAAQAAAEKTLAAPAPELERFVPGKTRCKYCGDRAFVRGTTTQPQPDGSVMISRSIKCGGPKRHTYELKELVRPKKAVK